MYVSKKVRKRFVVESNLIEGVHDCSPSPYFTHHFQVVERIVSRVRLSPNEIHHRLFRWGDHLAGQYRYGDVSVGQSAMPAPNHVPELMRDWEKEVELVYRACESDKLSRRERVLLCWYMHDTFICIHPYEDGNGRTARCLLNQFRFALGLSWKIVYKAKVSDYYANIRRFEVCWKSRNKDKYPTS